jgi:hypothetical protein
VNRADSIRMRNVRVAGLVLLATALNMNVVRAEYCRSVMPGRPSDARGFTFRAHVVEIRESETEAPLSVVALDVAKVYANAGSPALRVGGRIELYSNPCDGFALLDFRPGEELLVSTATLAGNGPSVWNTAVWRFERAKLRLLALGTQAKYWYTGDRRIAAADTLREALALVAPRAIAAPDTATEGTTNRGQPFLPLASLGLIALITVLLRIRPGTRTNA